MPDPRPELLFVAGPQKGQRAVLMSNEVLAGRSAAADVRLTEESASREHLRFTRTGEGWVVENLSPSGMVIEAKRFKAGKIILLATGDVIGVGRQTEILFVGPGDDPEAALAAYHAAHPQAPAPAPQVEVPPEAMEAVEPPTAQVQPPAAPPAGKPAQAQAAAAPADTEARARKLKKYAIAFGIYVLVMVGVIVLFNSMRKRQQAAAPSAVPQLTADDIETILAKPSPKPLTDAQADKALRDALAFYANRKLTRGGLYLCVRAFKQYQEVRKSFEDVQHGLQYRQAQQELIEAVTKAYTRAVFLEQAREWALAAEEWQKLHQMIPETDPDSPVHVELVRNIDAHWALSKARIDRRR